MYELRRIRLYSVGPKGARYSNLTIDLSDVGRRVPRPAQSALFDDGDPVPARRPAPASVLFLENGGGKSVLIKLVFSVVLPGRRQIVGTSNTQVLTRFVLADDVAHIALEWQHTVTGERVVMGKVSAWRGHVASGDPNKLSERWYSFRPTAAMTLDTLPFTLDGRRVGLAGFGDRLAEAHRAAPELQLVWESTQAQWTDHLDRLGLDPELFRYQRQMNAGEGEAADAFNFATDEAFVDFLLRAVTDETDPNGLAEVVNGYADKLADRQTLQAERDFVAGALTHLGPLATAATAADEATTQVDRERRAAHRFVGAVTVRHDFETRRLAALENRVVDAGADEREADQNSRRLNAVELEMRRLVAGLRLAAARRRHEDLEEQLKSAQDHLGAWRATEVLLRYRSARAEALGVHAILNEQEAKARPALAGRNQAAELLVRGLLGVARLADDGASTAESRAAELNTGAERARLDSEESTGLAATATERTRSARARIAAARTILAQAVTNGLLADGADPAAAAIEADEVARVAAETVTAVVADQQALFDQTERANTELRGAELAAGRAADTARRALEALDTANGAAEALRAAERLASLLGVERVEPDRDAPALRECLAAALEAAGTERDGLRVADAADQRMLGALGAGGLLPPGDDITAALEVLEAKGITAWSGWRYLATIRPDERDRTLATHPHLVGGLVLNNPDHLDGARQALRVAQLLPTTIVAVGTTAAMLAPDVPAPAGFVLPPNPAMYDEDAAERRRTELVAAQQARQVRLAALAARSRVDTDLSHQVESWQRDYPPGSLDRLGTEADDAAKLQRTAERRQAETRARLDELVRDDKRLRARLRASREAESTQRYRAERLARLADQTRDITVWAAEAQEFEQAAADAAADAAEANRLAGRLRDAAGESYRAAGDHRRTAAACREELRQVQGEVSADVLSTTAVSGKPADGAGRPAEPVETLRAAYRAAVSAYQQVEVGIDLRAELNRVDGAEAQQRAELESVPTSVQETAAELAGGPDGADAAARAAATARAGRAEARLVAEVTRAAGEVAVLHSEYTKMQPQDRSLEPYGPPRDIGHGVELLTRVHADWEEARAAYERARDRRANVEREVTDASALATGFDAVLDSFPDRAPVESDVVPYPGGLDAARARRDEVRAALADATTSLAEAQRVLRGAADRLARYAAEAAFEKVVSPVRRQMIAVAREDLPTHAADWESALRPRLRTLDDDLSQINRHRLGIIARLHGMVDGALGTLRSAQRVSKLPDGLGDWSGQEFLRIRFTEPDYDLLHERLGTVVDEMAGGTRSLKRDGMSLLLQGVRAAVAKGVRVEMLKPDAVLRTERVRVAEISDVFSGGQLLTATIILYCTMAALRANDRGQSRRPHAGVLFLDNPIGRASAGYLLELQLSVAETLGVQLVYTTGLFDTNALSVFPLIVRLRNDADLRAGLKYLSVADEIRRPLDALDAPDGSGRISATRLFTRPADTAPANGPTSDSGATWDDDRTPTDTAPDRGGADDERRDP